MSQVYAVFHLNLAYSSIDESQHDQVIERCYAPLLDIIEQDGIPLGIELSSWTLTRIQELRPEWVTRFRRLLQVGRCELIGSGYTQMIGPLVPYEVNLWNQRFGLDDYQAVLGMRPALALVNEMAYSSGMVALYQDAGYAGIIMDRDNVSLALGLEGDELLHMPGVAAGSDGAALPVLWSDSILFQKLQRYAHGDIGLSDYSDYFARRADSNPVLPLYCNDAEVFDFRPGRYEEEAEIHLEGEWRRVRSLFRHLGAARRVEWLSPSQALAVKQGLLSRQPVQLTSAWQPSPVKKQAKYNISRWAVTGRDDLWLNTLCQRLYRALGRCGTAAEDALRRRLCRCWGSDLRTHTTERRWHGARQEIDALCAALGVSPDYARRRFPGAVAASSEQDLLAAGYEVALCRDGTLLSIHCDGIELLLNLRRGLTIHSLAFREHGFTPVIGTLPQGYFHSIELGADFYSGGVVVEQLTHHRRITDLDWVTPELMLVDGELHIQARLETGAGPLRKRMVVAAATQTLGMHIGFPGWQRPYGTVRAGTLTLIPEAFAGELSVSYEAGGRHEESVVLNGPCDHHRPASSLVSCCSGIGATSGRISIGDAGRRVDVHWDRAQAALFPMLQHRPSQPSALTRLFFSLCEIDETFREGGELPDLELCIAPSVADAL